MLLLVGFQAQYPVQELYVAVLHSIDLKDRSHTKYAYIHQTTLHVTKELGVPSLCDPGFLWLLYSDKSLGTMLVHKVVVN